MQYISNLFKRYLVQNQLTDSPVNSDRNGCINCGNVPATNSPHRAGHSRENLSATQRSSDCHLDKPSETAQGTETIPQSVDSGIMDEEEKGQLIEDINRVKLELNQLKQRDTTIALQLQNKEEVYIQAEADFQLKEDQLKAKLDELVDEYEVNSKKRQADDDKQSMSKNLSDQHAIIERNEEEVAHYKNLISQYESNLSARNCEVEKLKQENDIVRKHVAALEAAYPDTVLKFERSKDIILGYVRNETTMKNALEHSNQRALKFEERYETLKTHANNQLDRAFKDILALKDQHHIETNKLATIIRRCDIKIASMEQTVEQKEAECKAFATLCDEMTGSAGLKSVD